MSPTDHDRPASSRHEGLLHSSPDHRRSRIDAWIRSAARHRHKVLTLAALLERDIIPDQWATTVTPIAPRDLHPGAEPAQLVRRALDEGFAGLSLLIWADAVIDSTSAEFHSAVETGLTDLCDHHRVSVLCCYDRAGSGADHLDMAVAHHADGLHEQQLAIRHGEATLHLDGEIDMNNIDVLMTALREFMQPGAGTIRIDLQPVRFVSAAAIKALADLAASFHDQGGRIELHGMTSHIPRMLQLLQLQPLPDRRSPPP